MSSQVTRISQGEPVDTGKLVEGTNTLSFAQFFERYCDQFAVQKASLEIERLLDRQLDIVAMHSDRLKAAELQTLDECFNLIAASSADDYKKSSKKWSPSSKRREMVLPDMKYLILREHDRMLEGGLAGTVCGFISFMITYEDGYEVVYIYEIHLAPEYQSQGVGKVLLNMVEDIGRKVGVRKCMLTVFKANKKAVRWYDRMDYRIDDFSPGPRVMRNGTVKEPSYSILSKDLD